MLCDSNSHSLCLLLCCILSYLEATRSLALTLSSDCWCLVVFIIYISVPTHMTLPLFLASLPNACTMCLRVSSTRMSSQVATDEIFSSEATALCWADSVPCFTLRVGSFLL